MAAISILATRYSPFSSAAFCSNSGDRNSGDRVMAEHQPLEHRLVSRAADLLRLGAITF
jgi:hypothetical protein